MTAAASSWAEGRIIAADNGFAGGVRLQMLVSDRQAHAPGQHYVIRLRAPDDYTAQRSYSIASDDSDPLVEFYVERMPGGEVSEFLADVAEVGDILELRGPIGRWFVWDTRTPAVALVGGSGVIPAVAMARTAHRLGRSGLLRVAAVGRTRSSLPFASELSRLGASLAFTREAVAGREPGAFSVEELAPLVVGAEVAFVCGSPRFCELAESLVVAAGMPVESIRVEQFGPTG